jgi:hypothetical protein
MGTSQSINSAKAAEAEDGEVVGSVDNVFYNTLLIFAQKNWENRGEMILGVDLRTFRMRLK